ncbi:hypothetical protein ACLB2K_049725 [Fragaria x ananassa]
MSIVRVLLSVAVNHGWPVFQMDVNNAFLYGDLEEEIYMQLPLGHSQFFDHIWYANQLALLWIASFSLKLQVFFSLMHVTSYQRLVGKLIYLTITRSDITFVVIIVSQFMQAPTQAHLHIVKRILLYLKGSAGRGILLKNHGNTHIMGYTDVDWAGNSLDRKSTTGFCTFVRGNLVIWKSKKQTVVACSSAEAEYRAMTATSCELI